MKDDVLSEIRAIIRTNLGPFTLDKESEGEYLIEGDGWEIEIDSTELGWSVLLKQNEGEGWEDSGLLVGEEHEIPTMLRELVKANF